MLLKFVESTLGGRLATVFAGSVAMATELNIMYRIPDIRNVLDVVCRCPSTMAMGACEVHTEKGWTVD